MRLPVHPASPSRTQAQELSPDEQLAQLSQLGFPIDKAQRPLACFRWRCGAHSSGRSATVASGLARASAAGVSSRPDFPWRVEKPSSGSCLRTCTCPSCLSSSRRELGLSDPTRRLGGFCGGRFGGDASSSWRDRRLAVGVAKAAVIASSKRSSSPPHLPRACTQAFFAGQ